MITCYRLHFHCNQETNIPVTIVENLPLAGQKFPGGWKKQTFLCAAHLHSFPENISHSFRSSVDYLIHIIIILNDFILIIDELLNIFTPYKCLKCIQCTNRLTKPKTVDLPVCS